MCIVSNFLCVKLPIFLHSGSACALAYLPYFLQWFCAFLRSFLLPNCSLLHLLFFAEFSRCHFLVLRNFCMPHFASFCVPGLLQALFLVRRFGLLSWCIFSLFCCSVQCLIFCCTNQLSCINLRLLVFVFLGAGVCFFGLLLTYKHPCRTASLFLPPHSSK